MIGHLYTSAEFRTKFGGGKLGGLPPPQTLPPVEKRSAGGKKSIEIGALGLQKLPFGAKIGI